MTGWWKNKIAFRVYDQVKFEKGEVTDFIVHEREPQVRFYNGVRRQQVLDFLQLLLAFLGRGVVLPSHWEILKKLQYTHCCTCKTQRAQVCNSFYLSCSEVKGLR